MLCIKHCEATRGRMAEKSEAGASARSFRQTRAEGGPVSFNEGSHSQRSMAETQKEALRTPGIWPL